MFLIHEFRLQSHFKVTPWWSAISVRSASGRFFPHRVSISTKPVTCQSAGYCEERHITYDMDSQDFWITGDLSDSSSPPDLSFAPSAEAQASAIGQKRRRVARACDTCRSKSKYPLIYFLILLEIKCDGKQPCTHCTVYSYECSYDQPSLRRRNAGNQYVESLEQRLRAMKTIFKTFLPQVDLNDLNVPIDEDWALQRNALTKSISNDDDQTSVGKMVDGLGGMHVDENGYKEFRGESAGATFMEHIRREVKDLMGQSGSQNSRPAEIFLPSASAPIYVPISSPMDSTSETVLPARVRAKELVDSCFEQAASSYSIFHRPSFDEAFERLYSNDMESLVGEELKFMVLLLLTCAVGHTYALGATSFDSQAPDIIPGNSISEGYKYFAAAKKLVDITDCRDIASIQAVVLMCVFLQSTSNPSTCYSYIGVALRASIRLGLHRKMGHGLSPIDHEVRKRLFWTIRNMDIHLSSILGLPAGILDQDIDQDLPIAVKDEHITVQGIQTLPGDYFCNMSAVNGQTQLLSILSKIVRKIYPSVPVRSKNGGYYISQNLIHEAEKEIESWISNLHPDIRPIGGNCFRSGAAKLLQVAYYHTKLLLYRPFLHYYISSPAPDKRGKGAFECAVACVTTARTVIHYLDDLIERREMCGGYWMTLYTSYTAILVLMYVALEKFDERNSGECLKDAEKGRERIAGLASESVPAQRCTLLLNGLFSNYYEKHGFEGPGLPSLENDQFLIPKAETNWYPNVAVNTGPQYSNFVDVKSDPFNPVKLEGLHDRAEGDMDSSHLEGSYPDYNPFMFPIGMLGNQEDPLLQNVNCKNCNEIFGTDSRNSGSVVPLIGPEGAQMNGWISDIK